MGKAARWFKAFFTFKKDNNVKNISETPFAGICQNPATIPPNISPSEAAWLRSFYIETEHEEQNKHAIAVAAATAAAADAAILAAQAAVEVVKLTGNGRVKTDEEMLQNCRERYAAIRIQSVFRGYLGRRALRALRSLVKIQAVVRGFLVRKQAAATLKCMQALVRAQETVRSRRVNGRDSRLSKEFASRRSLDNVEIRSLHSRRFSSTFESMADERAKVVEMDTGSRPKSSSRMRSRHNNLSVSESILNDQANYKAYYSSTRLSPYSHRESDWELNGDEIKFSTAHSTPKFSKRSSEWTPLNPSYMANTQSFRAKARSHSAPRQRSSDGVLKRRASLLELMEARKSLSHASASFKNAVMRKIDGSSREESDEGRNGNAITSMMFENE